MSLEIFGTDSSINHSYQISVPSHHYSLEYSSLYDLFREYIHWWKTLSTRIQSEGTSIRYFSPRLLRVIRGCPGSADFLAQQQLFAISPPSKPCSTDLFVIQEIKTGHHGPERPQSWKQQFVRLSSEQQVYLMCHSKGPLWSYVTKLYRKHLINLKSEDGERQRCLHREANNRGALTACTLCQCVYSSDVVSFELPCSFCCVLISMTMLFFGLWLRIISVLTVGKTYSYGGDASSIK